jgi:hypothetical protein
MDSDDDAPEEVHADNSDLVKLKELHEKTKIKIKRRLKKKVYEVTKDEEVDEVDKNMIKSVVNRGIIDEESVEEDGDERQGENERQGGRKHSKKM